MFSYEDRLRAVQLYIKLGKRIGLTIRQLGYPTKNALRNWVPARQRVRLGRMALMGPPAPPASRSCPPLALDAQERETLLLTLNSERFADTAPAAVHASLLGEGIYVGSVRTIYRVRAQNGGCGELRNQLIHPAYTKPELLAVAPNQVWSWDITKLKGLAKWTCFHLYVILDIFSRRASVVTPLLFLSLPLSLSNKDVAQAHKLVGR